jgi:Fe/S biogenesis protein NfuA
VENQPLLAISQTALERARGFRASLANPAAAGLSVGVIGSANGEYSCTLSLDPLSLAGSGDLVQNEGDLAIVVAADSIEKLRGATIDWRDDPPRSGFIVVNPNKPPRPLALPVLPMSLPADPGGAPGRRTPQAAPSAPAGNLDSDLARRVIAVLERDVNPAIAAHGGHAELVAVEGATAYLRLGGGCQGCGMATVTLSQGIEVAITEAVPQIDAIVDVTDHASGRNPYFEAAKK